MDDLKSKFKLTETYAVPGEVRKEPNFGDNPLSRTYARKEFTTPSKKTDEIKKILNELKFEAEDNKIDLEREFRRKNQKGQLTEQEFKDILYENRFKIEHRDIQKLVDRYINTVLNVIDTKALLEQMNQRLDSHREYSTPKAIRSLVRKDIITKIARKLHSKNL